MDNYEEIVVKQFSSIVNDVALVRLSNDKLVVRKRYYDYALKTGIKINNSRIEIEKRMYAFLSNYLKPYPTIKVPRILGYDKDRNALYFEYIAENRIVDQPSEEWPTLELWTMLREALFGLKDVKIDTVNHLFNDLYNIQEDNRNILYQYKLKDNIPSTKKNTLCLGDVNLSNLIHSDNSIYIVDLEFAHIGFWGYDIGQLLGHAKAVSDVNSLIDSYMFNAPESDECKYWKERFYHYYCESKSLKNVT